MKPIAVQMYSLREEVKKDLKNVLKRVADAGYKAVEPAGFYEMTAKDYKKLINSYGLEILSSHTPWTSLENINDVVETSKVFGLDIAAAGYGPDNFKDMEVIKKTADTINQMVDKLAKSGIKLFLHNHAWEFERINGKIKHHYIAEMCPNVLFEIDTYWASNFGAENPAEQVKFFNDRAVLLHIKDGGFVKGEPNTAVGSGKMDFPSVFNAANKKSIRAFVVEFDSCATDIFKAVEESYNYLTKNKFAIGNK
jgi:sugar phosphate isomerase/epimerase